MVRFPEMEHATVFVQTLAQYVPSLIGPVGAVAIQITNDINKLLEK